MESEKNINSINRLSIIAIVLMVAFSFTNLFGLKISGVTIFIGIAFFFVVNALEKQPTQGSGLDIKSIGADLKNKKIWFWILLPLIMDAVCIIIAKLFLPEYIEYEILRAGGFVAIELSISSFFLFLVFALGEEIAWRAFFQKQLNKALPIIPVLLFSSLLFTLGHFEKGNAVVVLYGLLFTFINSILYGVVFYKSNNAWISTISHFIANFFSIIVFVLIS